MTLEDAIDSHFESAQLELLRRLVDTPSHTWAPDDVELAAQILDEEAARLGLSRRAVPDDEGRFADHRVFSTPACGEQERALALVGHVDTVFPRSLGFLHFVRDEDTVRGPGTLDMKSGLTSILFALRAVKESAPDAWSRLKARFVCVSDEEVGSPSSVDLYEELAPLTSAALVFEAGRVDDEIVTCRKGSAVFTVTTRGVAAHAGNKHREGTNAVHALALLVPRIEALTDYDAGLTANVGLFDGGTARNTVPEEAKCVVDVRFTHLADVERVQRFFAELEKDPQLPQRLTAATVSVDGRVARPPMEATDETQALRLRYERHAADVGLKVGEAPLQGGGSDANLLAARGVPCIDGLGPWGQHFHKVQEHSSLDSLKRRTKALARFLLEEAGQ
jgi:glutamate carboxypeptidase